MLEKNCNGNPICTFPPYAKIAVTTYNDCSDGFFGVGCIGFYSGGVGDGVLGAGIKRQKVGIG